MNAVAAQEVKRRGMAAVDALLDEGPVRILKNNRPRYVVLSEAEYDALLGDLAEARLAASEADLRAGRTRRGTSADLMAELRREP
jgi:PHD/YefM family antitoxin component YafN of YafNO toxin-antitoxin module